MDLVKTGIVISQTIKNVGRLREIVGVFAKHGFSEFITRGVTAKIPDIVLPKSKALSKKELLSKESTDWGEIIGKRLRESFEELGPVFVKFGQLLSSREDIFPDSFINEMKKLRDNVKGVEFVKVKEAIEKSLNCNIGDIFKEVDESPVGTASIGVVYKGILVNGDKVVVKVRRPNIIKCIENDVSVLMFLANQIEKISEDIKAIGIRRIVSDFTVSLQGEVNFNTEALNATRFKENVEIHDENEVIYIPKVYGEFTREDIIIIELIEGVPFTNSELVNENKKILHPKIENGTAFDPAMMAVLIMGPNGPVHV